MDHIQSSFPNPKTFRTQRFRWEMHRVNSRLIKAGLPQKANNKLKEVVGNQQQNWKVGPLRG